METKQKPQKVKVPHDKGYTETVTTLIPCEEGVHIKVETKETTIPQDKVQDDFIIVDDDGAYWSEEEEGRWSGGALYEKTFKTRTEAEGYIEDNWEKIEDPEQAKAIRHREHWTHGRQIVYDSSKPGGTSINPN